MLKFFLNRIRRAEPGTPVIDQDTRLRWLRDPLSHPALEAMSERELADLPFRR
jgi:hypothetical protein